MGEVPAEAALSCSSAPAVAGASPPGEIVAAAVLTWVVATAAAGVGVFLAVGFWLIGGALFDVFDPGPSNPKWLLLGATVLLLALSALADVAALFVVRGRAWAWWVLLALACLAVVGGLLALFYIAPLVVSAAGLSVVVLLALPGSRAWCRSSPG